MAMAGAASFKPANLPGSFPECLFSAPFVEFPYRRTTIDGNDLLIQAARRTRLCRDRRIGP
jgi:hypothetical protein